MNTKIEDVLGAKHKHVTFEQVPCGENYTTEFLSAEGVVVRRDQLFVVTEGLSALGVKGEL
jgi:hypothetical protein